MGSVPTLNYDMISNILNIRMNQKRKDRIEAHKKIYGPVVQNMNNIFSDVHSEGSSLSIGDPESKYFIECIIELIEEENETIQRPYMPWENEWSGN